MKVARAVWTWTKSKRIVRDEEQEIPDTQFYGVLLSYDNTDYTATFRLGNGNEILLEEHYRCCSTIDQPANINPYVGTGYIWRSCAYTYTGATAGMISGSIDSSAGDIITIDSIEYDISPYGVIVYNTLTGDYLGISDVVGGTANIYRDSEGRVALITVAQNS